MIDRFVLTRIELRLLFRDAQYCRFEHVPNRFVLLILCTNLTFKNNRAVDVLYKVVINSKNVLFTVKNVELSHFQNTENISMVFERFVHDFYL